MSKVSPHFIINFYLRHIKVLKYMQEKNEKIILRKPQLKRKLLRMVNMNTKKEVPHGANKIGRCRCEYITRRTARIMRGTFK